VAAGGQYSLLRCAMHAVMVDETFVGYAQWCADCEDGDWYALLAHAPSIMNHGGKWASVYYIEIAHPLNTMLAFRGWAVWMWHRFSLHR